MKQLKPMGPGIDRAIGMLPKPAYSRLSYRESLRFTHDA